MSDPFRWRNQTRKLPAPSLPLALLSASTSVPAEGLLASRLQRSTFSSRSVRSANRALALVGESDVRFLSSNLLAMKHLSKRSRLWRHAKWCGTVSREMNRVEWSQSQTRSLPNEAKVNKTYPGPSWGSNLRHTSKKKGARHCCSGTRLELHNHLATTRNVTSLTSKTLSVPSAAIEFQI